MPTTILATVHAGDGGVSERHFEVHRQYNLGSAARDAAVAKHHQDEVAQEGIRIPFDIPAPRIYPIAPWALTTASNIAVQGSHTSGEVEIVLVVDDELYVGVGSDHTDRELERTSIPWSKQACPNVLAPVLWRWADVADHWDHCQLTCDLEGQPYQRVGVDAFLAPPDLLAVLRSRADVPERGFVVFSGTYASVTGQLGFGTRWSIGLHDPVRGRTIEHSYDVSQLLPEIHEGHRVPLVAGGA